MSKKPLIETNSHLRDSKGYRKALVTNVASSTAVETGAAVALVARALTKRGYDRTFQELSAVRSIIRENIASIGR